MRARIAVVVMACALGCGRLDYDVARDGAFGLDAGPTLDGGAPSDAEPIDATSPVDASAPPSAGFGSPLSLGFGGSDPQIREDMLELWASVGSPRYDLAVSRRAATSDPWPPLAVHPALSGADIETEPALSADGLVLMFVRDFAEVLEARRTAVTDDFTTASPALGLVGVNARSIDLLPDGNVLYFDDGTDVVRRVSRPSRDAPFGAPSPPLGVTLGWPTVSPDELQIFGSDSAGSMRWYTRSSTTSPFVDRGILDLGAPCPVGAVADPDIWLGGARLAVLCASIVHVYSR